MRHNLIVACVLAVSYGTAAQADWSGMYGGLSISANDADAHDLTFGAPFELDGASVGLFGGFNHQINQVVYGVEFGLNLGGPEGNDGDFLLPLTVENSIVLRGRVGYDSGAFLPYLAAGVVSSSVEADHDGLNNPADFASTRMTGGIFALGVDYALSDRSFIRFEAARTRYRDDTLPFYDNTDPHELSLETTSFTIGYALRF